MIKSILPIIQVIFVLVMIVQVIMAILNINNRKRHAMRLNFVLSSRTSVVEMLEKYSRIFDPLDIKVNAEIEDPAMFRKDMLYINRKWVYEHHAYPTLTTLLEIIRYSQNSKLERIVWVQQFLFIGEIILLGLSLYSSIIVIMALIVAIMALGLGIYFEIRVGQQIDDTVDLANDLLDLNEYESEKAFELLEVYQNQAHTYPVQLVYQVLQFFRFW